MKILKKALPFLAGVFLLSTISFGQTSRANTMAETKISYDKEPKDEDFKIPPQLLELKKRQAISFSMSPNPAKDVLVLTHPMFSNPQVIRIYDLVGHVVLKCTTEFGDNTRTQIDISQLRSGIYLVMLKDQTLKLSIQ